MRVPLSVLLAVLACSDLDPPRGISVLDTNASSYVAEDDPDPRFDYMLTVIVTHRNPTELIVRVPQCTATITHAKYSVQKAGSGEAAWNPNITCATFGTPYQDLRPGQEHTDTLLLRSPWQRLFNGQPIGDTEGTFYLMYETQICATVSANGLCSPSNRIEFVRSNTFVVSK
jgi:hypothetical protein